MCLWWLCLNAERGWTRNLTPSSMLTGDCTDTYFRCQVSHPEPWNGNQSPWRSEDGQEKHYLDPLTETTSIWTLGSKWEQQKRRGKCECCPASLCQYWERKDPMQCSKRGGHKQVIKKEIVLRVDFSICGFSTTDWSYFFILSSQLTWIATSKWNFVKRVEIVGPCQFTTNESILMLPPHLWVFEKLFSKHSV